MTQNLLLDTHSLLWWWFGDPRLPDRVRESLSARDHMVSVSTVSGWEIATKFRLGRLPEAAEIVEHYDSSILADGFRHLPLREGHGIRAGLLAGPHRDPFDRMIAAQALMEDMTVITRDREIAAFGCKVLWQ